MYITRDTNNDSTSYTTYNPWKWQKWSLFAIFIILMVLLVVATLRANYNRIRHGRQPIRGTGWFTPPSYQQSEREYNHDDGIHVDRHNNRRQREENIPKYTEEVGEEDLGFYDTNGVFHENIKGKMMSPPDIEGGTLSVPLHQENGTEYVEADEENIFGIETPEHTASRQRIRSYYNNTHNTSNVEASRGSSSNVEESHELENLNHSNPKRPFSTDS
ncbi:hypothetical protein D499_0AO00150 [Hanseniaspora uvarum DSM 2768]|uniref:Protein RCR2 n=1 Tax=Hanseniaspora uvarum TaxID=29833 RepID=A0A1E5R9W8_HANUV|nr:hypothetical protein FOG48_02954 [Hanseniaspora uvarum]KAF0275432.1 hypothetical protein FOG50_03723 [Hanseniaspora uvarum]KKA01137.1 hypothetical protein D499_0AO00150 [Hanseniaspora uvarum DSM 2768]OEJ83700.1 Protein RCR2 [Hanseniaspora uvarum]GMM41047.1 Rcr2 protein [Hanseniaspora uvarum]